MKSKKLIIASVSVLVLLVAGYLVLSGGDDGRAGDGPGRSSAKKGGGFFDFFGGGADSVEEQLSPKQVLLKQAAEYRARAAFPPYSHPLTKDNDPVVKDFAIVPEEARAFADGKPVDSPYLVHYVAARSFEPDQPILLHAYLTDGSKRRLPITDGKAFLTIGGMQGRVLATATFADDGAPGDKKGDGIFTASFAVPQAIARKLPMSLTAVIKVNIDAGEVTATNMVNVGSLGISHTGTFRDSQVSDARGKHLAIEADFDVAHPGTFHVQGSLYDGAGQPLGWSQARVQLSAGKQTVTLKYYGKMFCDSGASGPYSLRNFAYMNVGKMPGPRSDNKQNVHTTAAYSAKDFTCASFEDKNFLAKAALLEKEAEVEK